MPQRIGLFGGTFDPPHVGHLVTAVNVRHALRLDLVVLMVANVPWQKVGSRAVTPAEDRLAMVQAAVGDVDGLVAGRTEIDRGGASYTADTLAALAEAYPGADLFTIVGDDAAAGLLSWERYEEVAARSGLVVVDRPGAPVVLPGGFDWIRVEVPRLEVSSTDLRARCADGRPLDYLVTEPVLDVIVERGLYSGGVGVTVLARNRHRRTAVMLAINLLAIVALGGMGYAGYKALRRYEGGKRVDRQEVPLSPTPVGMLATVDAQDRLTTVTIMVLTPEAQGFKGGSIVSVPVSADTAFGVDGQRIPLTQVYAEGGVDGLVSGVESVLAITLDVWEVATPEQAEPLFTAITPFTATFPQDVDGGTLTAPELLYPAGEAGLSAAQVVAVLNTRVEGATDASRRANVLALWSAVSTAVGSGRTQVANVEPVVTGPFVSPVGDLADLMARLFAGPVASRGVAATALAPGEAPAGVDAEALDFADAVMVFGAVAPSAMSATRDALVYRIEAPPGYDAQVKWAVTLVLYFGFNVQSVYVSASVPSHSYTEIEIYDERSQDQAASANDLFGEYRFVEPAYRIEGVEVVMRLGTDFLTGTGGVASGDTLPTTTTSTTIG